MTDRRTDAERCTLCGTALSASAVDLGSDGTYCSSGCRDIDRVLTGTEHEDGREFDGERPREEGVGEPQTAGHLEGEIVSTFFRVDGMHTATCEAFLESVAEASDGVVGAEASYVTETVRVDYDPERISKDTLRDTLSTLGYTAYLREEATGSESGGDSTGGTQRSREMTGIRKRRADELLEVRYIVGIVFGSFLMIPYVTILYPVYLSSFADWWFLSLYEDAFTSFDGMVFLPVFFVLTGAVLYLTGMPLLRGAYVSLKLRRPNTHLLAALTVVGAYLYGTLAFVLERNDIYYDVTILVAAIVMAGFFYEATVKRRALDVLTELTISQVNEATLYESDGTTETVSVVDLEPGDCVLVRHGERIPVDGTVLENACTVDESVVTGESRPIVKRVGDDVVGGSTVTTGGALVAVGERTSSHIDRLTQAVWNLQSADHGVQRRGDRLAARFTPLVVLAAVAVGVAHVLLGTSTATVFLFVLVTVIAVSPWALGLATTLSVAASMDEAIERGIVVFDETVFERLRDVDVVVFDKTGTLTTGTLTVLEVDAPPDVVRAATAVEKRASHPAADALEAAASTLDANGGTTNTDGGSVDGAREGDYQVHDFRTHTTGVEGNVDGHTVLVGHPDLFTERGWTLGQDLERRVRDVRHAGHLPVVVGRDGSADGVVVLGDEPREGWEETITGLSETGLTTVVLTGDDDAATGFFRDHPHVDHVFARVPPAGKTAAIRRLSADARVAMVGDGTNDAPALAEADLGISLGSGTALASDAADLAIVDDDLTAVDRAFRLSLAARRRLSQNLALAFVYNVLVIPAAVIGVLNPLFATAAILVTSLLVVANSSRALVSS